MILSHYAGRYRHQNAYEFNDFIYTHYYPLVLFL